MVTQGAGVALGEAGLAPLVDAGLKQGPLLSPAISRLSEYLITLFVCMYVSAFVTHFSYLLLLVYVNHRFESV